jgi:hypothetical protein
VVHADDAGRRVGEQRRGLGLADLVVGDAVPAIDHLLGGGVEDLERMIVIAWCFEIVF